MDRDVLLQRAASGQVPEAVGLEGDDDGLVREALTACISGSGADAADVVKLDSSARPEQVTGEALTVPLFSDIRVLVAQGVQDWSQDAQAALASALDALPDTNRLIITASRLPAAISRGVKKRGVVVQCAPMKPDVFAGWVREQFQREGRSIKPDALQVFCEGCGNSTAEARLEMLKLLAYTDGRSTVTLDDVWSVMSRTVRTQVFRIMDATMQGQAAEAVRLLHDLYLAGEPPEAVAPEVIGLLARQVKLVWQARVAREYGQRLTNWQPEDNGLEALCQRQPFMQRKLDGFAARLSLVRIEAMWEAICEADWALKGIEGAGSPIETVLDDLIVRLCQQK